MKPFPIEELVDRCGSRFTVVVAAAKRAKQIKEGAPPLVNLPTRNPLTIALHEIAAGLVEITEEPVIVEAPVAVAVEEAPETIAPDLVAELLGRSIVEDLVEVTAGDDDVDLDDEIAEDLDEDLEDEDDEDEDEGDEGDDLEVEEDDDWEEEV